MNAPRPNLADTCVVAFSGSLVTLGCFNLASDANADVLADWQHFAPTHVEVEGKEIHQEVPGVPEWSRVLEVDGLMRWDTTEECNLNSRLYNFCSGKSTVFEFEVWLSDHRTVYPQEYSLAWRNIRDEADWGWGTSLPDTNYLDTNTCDKEEFSMTVGTLSARDISARTPYYTVVRSERTYSEGPNWFKVGVAVGKNDAKVDWACESLVPAEWCMLSESDAAVAIPFCYRYTFPGTGSWDWEWVDPKFRCREGED